MEHTNTARLTPPISPVKNLSVAEHPRYSERTQTKAAVLEAFAAGLITKSQTYAIFHQLGWRGVGRE